MFPTTEQKTDRKYQDLDNLLSELNQPKEQIYNSHNPAPGKQPGENDLQQQNNSGYTEEPEPPETLSPEVAALSGKTIAGTIDTVFGTGCSLYAKTKDAEKYQATTRQLEQLNNAWAAVAMKYGYKVEDSPWLNLGLLTTAVYLPKFQEAKNDRRFAEMDEKFQEMERKIQENEVRLKKVETQPDK